MQLIWSTDDKYALVRLDKLCISTRNTIYKLFSDFKANLFSDFPDLIPDTVPNIPEQTNAGAEQHQQGAWTDNKNNIVQQFGAAFMPGPVLPNEETAKALADPEKESDKVGDAVNNEIEHVDINPEVEVPFQETVAQKAAAIGLNDENNEPINSEIVHTNPIVSQGQVEDSVPVVPVADVVNDLGDGVANMNVPAVNPVDSYASNNEPINNIESVNNNDNNGDALGNPIMPQQNLENPEAENPDFPQVHVALQNNLENTNVHEMDNQQPEQNIDQNNVNGQQPQIQSLDAAQPGSLVNDNVFNAPQDKVLEQGLPQINDPNRAGVGPQLDGSNRLGEQVPNGGAVLPEQNQQVIPAAQLPQIPQDLSNSRTNTFLSQNGENRPLENIQPVPIVPASVFNGQSAGEQAVLEASKPGIGQVPTVNENLQKTVQTVPDQSVMGFPNNQMPAQGPVDGMIPAQTAVDATGFQAPVQGVAVQVQAVPDQGAPVGTGVQMPVQGVAQQGTVVSPDMQSQGQAVPDQGAPIVTGGQLPVQGIVPQAVPDQGTPVGTGSQLTAQGIAPQGMPLGTGAQLPAEGIAPQGMPVDTGAQFPAQGIAPQGMPVRTGAQFLAQGIAPQRTPVGTGAQFSTQGIAPQGMPVGTGAQFQAQGIAPQGTPVGTGAQFPAQGNAPRVNDVDTTSMRFKTSTSLSTETTPSPSPKWVTSASKNYLNNTDNADIARQDADYDYKGDDNDEFNDGDDLDDNDGFYGDDNGDDNDDDMFDDMDADANDENLQHAWRNWGADDDGGDYNDDGDDDDQADYKWPQKVSTEQTSTTSGESNFAFYWTCQIYCIISLNICIHYENMPM